MRLKLPPESTRFKFSESRDAEPRIKARDTPHHRAYHAVTDAQCFEAQTSKLGVWSMALQPVTKSPVADLVSIYRGRNFQVKRREGDKEGRTELGCTLECIR